MKKLLSCISIFLLTQTLLSQTASRFGAEITPEGDYRVLVICVDINWTPQQLQIIQQVPGYSNWTSTSGSWQQGMTSPPTSVQNLFDVTWNGSGTNEFTKYFAEMSIDNYRMVGDVFSHVVQVDGDSLNVFWDYTEIGRQACRTADTTFSFQTLGGLNISDFDSWESTDTTGAPKINSSNDSVDNIIFIYRNIGPFLTGGAAPFSSSELMTDIVGDTTYTFYNKGVDNHTHFSYVGLDIFKHEYGHHLLGGLQFHAAGGHDRLQDSYYIATQGGWGIMGSAAASLKTINAWERRRLDWKAPGRNLNISCMNGSTEVDTDLDATDTGDEDTYVLQDFVTKGDAIRIKLPFLPGSEFQQWLWIENHQGFSEYDNHNHRSCQTSFQPGLYMYIQTHKETLSGSGTFSGYADYIKPLAASGLYDVNVGDLHTYDCGVGNETHHIQTWLGSNPLSGYSDYQQTDYDIDGDEHLMFAEREAILVQSIGGNPTPNWAWRGHTRHAFHNGAGGNTKIGIATNPSTASHITLVSNDSSITLDSTSLQNNRTIYLNGISVEITNYNSGSGAITVDVEFDDILLDEDTRWCADDIVLPNMAGIYPSLSGQGWSLRLKANQTLDIDRNKMPTRLDSPDTIIPPSGPWDILFNDPTTFRMESGAKMKAYEGSVINLKHGSRMILGEDNELDIENATLNVLYGSTLVLNGGSLLDLSGNGGTVFIDTSSTLIIRGDAGIHLNGDNSQLVIRGNVIVEDSGTFGFSGSGYIRFSGSIDNDNTARWPLRGDDMDDLVMVLYQTAEWNGGQVDFSTGKIEYASPNIEIAINDCDEVLVNGMKFTSQVYGYTYDDNKALHLNNSSINCTSSEFHYFYNGIIAADYSDTALVTNCSFESTVFPIEVSEYDGLILSNSELESVGNLPSGPISYYNAGLKVDNTPFVQMDLTDIVSCAYGVQLDSVDGFYMRSGTIDSCDFGIRSTESLVFLRNGATVQNSLEFGVHALGRDPLNSMITVGDSGCANIINNDAGISGMGTTINIDAYIHAENSGTPSFVQYNRLDQNPNNYVEMCYHDSVGMYIPDTVHLKGVYFGGSAPSGNDFETYKSAYYYPQNWSCGTPITDITDDYTQHSTCTPQGICDCYAGTSPQGNGSFGGVYNKMSNSEIDTLRYSVEFNPFHSEQTNLSKLVLASFRDANLGFLHEDSKTSRSNFIPLASVGLVRIDDEWFGLSNRDNIFQLDQSSIHRIVVAKVLTNFPLGPSKDYPNIFKEYNDWVSSNHNEPVISVYPNPSLNVINIDVSGEEKKLNYSIVSKLGTVLKKGLISTGTNTINIADMSPGVYLIQIEMENRVQTKKIIKSAK